MAHRHNWHPVFRDLGALLAALLVSTGVNVLLGRVGLAVAGSSSNAISSAAVFVVVMFFVVPATAGAVLGVLAAHPVALAIPLVALSLALTYLSLGPAGMPRGWKILEYVVQTALVAGAAALVSVHTRRPPP
jgi:hypothetical protein